MGHIIALRSVYAVFVQFRATLCPGPARNCVRYWRSAFGSSPTSPASSCGRSTRSVFPRWPLLHGQSAPVVSTMPPCACCLTSKSSMTASATSSCASLARAEHHAYRAGSAGAHSRALGYTRRPGTTDAVLTVREEGRRGGRSGATPTAWKEPDLTKHAARRRALSHADFWIAVSAQVCAGRALNRPSRARTARAFPSPARRRNPP